MQKVASMNRVKHLFTMLNPSKAIIANDCWRPLSVKEKVLLQLGDKQMLQFSSVLFVSSRQPIRENNITRSLLCIAKRHPLLHACIVTQNNTHYWKRMNNIKLNFKIDQTTDWEQVLSNSFDYRHDFDNGPLWQMIYLPNAVSPFADKTLAHHSAFLFNTNHAILDGQGLQYFYKDLRDLLCRLENKEGQDTIEETEGKCLDVPHALDDYTLKDMPATYRLLDKVGNILPFSYMARYFVKKMQLTTDPCETFYRCTSSTNPVNIHTRMIPVVINEKDLEVIAQACKTKTVGINAAVLAASKRAMREIVQERARKLGLPYKQIPKVHIKLSAAKPHYEQRSDYDTEESFVKTYAWTCIDHIDMGSTETDFWSSAKFDDQFMKNNRQQMRFINYLASKFFDVDFFSSLPKEARTCSLSFSNVGKVKMLDNEPNATIKFTGQFNPVSEHFRGPAISHTLLTFDNKLFWAFMYFPPVTDDTMAQSYITRCLDILLRECKNKVSVC